MAVPKRRTSRSRKGSRRSHHHAKSPQVQYCPNCNDAFLPHRVCANCGYFQGRIVVETEQEK